LRSWGLAEGIEEQAQLERLESEQVDHGQGFLFARPLEAEAIESFLNEHSAHTSVR
jgi:EAL domain-containing protein (putative c-di-GMP-specific phosphodiesterase class I)